MFLLQPLYVNLIWQLVLVVVIAEDRTDALVFLLLVAAMCMSMTCVIVTVLMMEFIPLIQLLSNVVSSVTTCKV